MSKDIVSLDVREDLKLGREPFSKIMSSAAALLPRQTLRLLAPFEPVPLFQILAQQGFSHRAHPIANGDWEVLFFRSSENPSAAAQLSGSQRSPAAPSASAPQRDTLEVDARGLEPPEPLVRILEALETLPPSAILLARTDRRPMHLFPHLKERGFASDTTKQVDGSYLTTIRRG